MEAEKNKKRKMAVLKINKDAEPNNNAAADFVPRVHRKNKKATTELPPNSPVLAQRRVITRAFARRLALDGDPMEHFSLSKLKIKITPTRPKKKNYSDSDSSDSEYNKKEKSKKQKLNNKKKAVGKKPSRRSISPTKLSSDEEDSSALVPVVASTSPPPGAVAAAVLPTKNKTKEMVQPPTKKIKSDIKGKNSTRKNKITSMVSKQPGNVVSGPAALSSSTSSKEGRSQVVTEALVVVQQPAMLEVLEPSTSSGSQGSMMTDAKAIVGIKPGTLEAVEELRELVLPASSTQPDSQASTNDARPQFPVEVSEIPMFSGQIEPVAQVQPNSSTVSATVPIDKGNRPKHVFPVHPQSPSLRLRLETSRLDTLYEDEAQEPTGVFDLDKTYVIETHGGEADQSIQFLDDVSFSPADNYNITLFHEYDENMTHREGKKISKWAKSHEFVSEQLFKTQPNLMKILYGRRTDSPIFPAVDVKKKLFPSAFAPKPTH